MSSLRWLLYVACCYPVNLHETSAKRAPTVRRRRCANGASIWLAGPCLGPDLSVTACLRNLGRAWHSASFRVNVLNIVSWNQVFGSVVVTISVLSWPGSCRISQRFTNLALSLDNKHQVTPIGLTNMILGRSSRVRCLSPELTLNTASTAPIWHYCTSFWFAFVFLV